MPVAPTSTINYVLQPSFEIATPGYIGNNGNLSLTSSSFLYGAQALRWTCISTTGSTSPRVTSPNGSPNTVAALPAGSTYNVSVWVKYSVTRSAQIQALTTGANPTGTLTSCVAGVWTRLSVSGTLPGGGTLLNWQIYTAGCTAGEIMDVDGAQVTVGSTLWDYFDGAQPGASWIGTPHNSASIYAGVAPGTISAYMPDVKVEIAWDSGYSTPAASRTWTDVSKYVELAAGINITHGRGDEFATAEPNHLNLTLDNSDGRFTAGKTAGAYYPNVKIGRPIRVTSTPVGGVASVRFVGYVDEWPVAWDGTDNYAKAQITASSRMARLGFDAELRSIIEEQYLVSGPIAYYTMGDPAGSLVASDSSSGGIGQLLFAGSGPAPVFGTATGPGNDSLTAVTFADGRYFTPGAPVPTPLTALTLSTYINISPGGSGDLIGIANAATLSGLALSVVPGTGVLNAAGHLSGPSVADGLTHHAAYTIDAAGNDALYLDGVLVASGSIGSFSWSSFVFAIGSVVIGTMAHAALFNRALSAAEVSGQARAGLDGFNTDTASARIGRYATFAGVPAVEYVGDANTNLVADIDTTGSSAIDNMRKVEETEGGVLFDARDNTLTFKGRAARYNVASALTLSALLQEIEADITPKLDRSALVNDVTATAADGSTARATNPTSIANYGYARASVEIAASNDEAFQAASWQVNIYGEPAPRIPSLGVDILPMTQAAQDAFLAADIGTRITTTALPSQAPATTLDFFIEGYTETIGPVSYTFDLNVSPVTGYDVFTLDDAIKGVLDNTTYKLAY